MTTTIYAMSVLAEVWQGLGLPPEALARVQIKGRDPVLPSTFAVGTAAAVSIAAATAAAAYYERYATGRAQDVAVDTLHAALECRSERYIRRDGGALPDIWNELSGAYRCADGWVRLHTNFAHHNDGVVRLLACAPTRAAVADALRTWPGEHFESAATAAGLVVSYVRSFAQWDQHPQSAAVAAAPLVEIERIGDAAPRPLVRGPRPLSGMRVLEMTRIIAGPVAGRALAAHGANVLRVIGPDVPTIETLDIDTGRGKRAAFLDIATRDGRSKYLSLARDVDVVLQSYRPGVVERYALGVETLAEEAPGVVLASLSAYGWTGPWAGKRGFDSLVQAATGFNHAEAAGTDTPRVLPLQILDHASGYLLAAGILAARLRQAQDGGTWRVRVFLARTGQWLRDLGRVADGLTCPEPDAGRIAAYLATGPSGYGALTYVTHAGLTSLTPPTWDKLGEPYGATSAAWSQ